MAAASTLLTSCAVNEPRPGDDVGGFEGIVVGAGSSAQQAAQEAWTVGFQNENPRATVEYDPTGSGAGRDIFIAGGSSFAGSDRAFTVEELESESFAACTEGSNIIELPAYISPIAIAFTLEGIDTLQLRPDTIARIFTGEITRWNDPAIVADNPGVSLPDQVITPIHRSDDSGVTENFTEYLAAAASEAWPYEPSGEWPLEGEAAQGTSGVVSALTNSSGAIGYIDASRAGDLGVVSVGVGGQFVPYSSEAAAAIIDASPVGEHRTEGDLAVEIDRTSTAPGVYPIVLVSYLIACDDYLDESDAELVRAYFAHAISDEGQQQAADAAGSAPISPTLAERAASAVALID
ncbi:phosphate ABC transporter substrate-binding protein PstS [Salinibacterium sp. SYSU T00001]|uniref:phosphate ABC transporter substrate-binding protein PstS n=1 Tax=Homoserinimonas sedimenticola TaxID=2986805 RepID=UPI00223676F9|nr:phosphate ABC transporter substrate-binding protein PstS [Salinibacterium sedimenticola]MCW4386112.1 phosphate ABC transporter substrate-binding protein PstS [Salinibacterium sedimenticola]